jgi:8-oxo-dGTP pyrophosphatase MutT (NUDIX family)
MKRNGPWQVLSSEVKYQTHWLKVREDKVVQKNGVEGIFGVVEMLPGASILALDKDNNAYLIREHRYAIEKQSLEVSSGGVEVGEDPVAAAKRELKEETGLTSEKWTDLGELDPFTAIIDSRDHMYLAENVVQGERDLDADELIEVVKMPFEIAVEKAMSGEITHGASVVAILKTKLLRDKTNT